MSIAPVPVVPPTLPRAILQPQTVGSFNGTRRRVLLVDPVPWSRRLLEIELGSDGQLDVVVLSNLGDLCLTAKGIQPDLVLLSLSTVGDVELELIRTLAATSSAPCIGLLTDTVDQRIMFEARVGGVTTYLVRSDELQLAEMVRIAASGSVLLSPTAAEAARIVLARTAALEPKAPAALGKTLTAQQLRVLSLVAKGLTNAEIGGQLQIEVNTVKSHLKRLLFLLGQPDRKQLMAFAHDRGLFRSPIYADSLQSDATC